MTVTMGIDPHKTTHMAVAIDDHEQPIGWVELVADRSQTQRLLAWVEPLGDKRVWAIESARGLGQLLAQQLVAAGEDVVDVPPTLSARVRLLGSTKASKGHRRSDRGGRHHAFAGHLHGAHGRGDPRHGGCHSGNAGRGEEGGQPARRQGREAVTVPIISEEVGIRISADTNGNADCV